jgi:DNA uptake protein ComE-like DNA-binding protein
VSTGKDLAQRSRWPYVSLAPFGLGAWAPIYAGSKAQQKNWVVWGVLWTLIALAGWILAVAQNGNGGAGGLLLILGWAGGAATSFSIRSAYDRRMGSALLEAQETAEAALRDREEARRIARERPALAQQMGIGRPDVSGAADAGLVDVNNASVTALLKLPGVDGDIATEIIEGRGRINGFSSLEDMGAALDLDGNLVEGLRNEVIFLPRR